MDNFVHILVININNIKMTGKLIHDIFNQTHPYTLTIVDNGSSEKGTTEYLSSISEPQIRVIYNKTNEPINRLWNDLYETSSDSYLCFLNNDIRISSNFVSDTVEILNKERGVGCVIHATNHPDYQRVKPLEYVILKDKVVQGWDFTIRRKVYNLIPEELRWFGGDDYLYEKMYSNGWKIAMALSSPVIHYKAKSRRYYPGNREEETNSIKKYMSEKMPYICEYTRHFPTFRQIYEQ